MTIPEQAEQLYDKIVPYDVISRAAKLKRIEAIEAALRDAVTEKKAVISDLAVQLRDAQDAILQQAQRYQAQCEAEDALEEKCARLEQEKRDVKRATWEAAIVIAQDYIGLSTELWSKKYGSKILLVDALAAKAKE